MHTSTYLRLFSPTGGWYLRRQQLRKRGTGVLEQKAALYDQLKNGSIAPEAAQQAGFLVDFDQGRHSSAATNRSSCGASSSSSSSTNGTSSGVGRGSREGELTDLGDVRPSQFTLRPDEVEIEDEFGREVSFW